MAPGLPERFGERWGGRDLHLRPQAHYGKHCADAFGSCPAHPGLQPAPLGACPLSSLIRSNLVPGLQQSIKAS